MSNQKTLAEGKEMLYNHFRIYHNQWGEYCVSRKLSGRMVSYNSGFANLADAKKFINLINPQELELVQIVEIANKIKNKKSLQQRESKFLN